MLTILEGHALDRLRELPAESVQMCCTSPPYWSLRNYGTPPIVWGGAAACTHEWIETSDKISGGRRQIPHGDGRLKDSYADDRHPYPESEIISHAGFCQKCGAWLGHLGLEPTPELYTAHIVEIFREVFRVLRNDGTLWLNLGDCFFSQPGNGRGGGSTLQGGRPHLTGAKRGGGLKPKDLVGIPWRCAFALQADGWWLRSDIIWAKPNPMPESVTDRPTRSHEYVFLLSKAERYFYDAAAIAEPVAESSTARISQENFWNQTGGDKDYGPDSNRSQRKTLENFAKRSWKGSSFDKGKTGEMKHTRGGRKPRSDKQGELGIRTYAGFNEGWNEAEENGAAPAMRNKRDVWTIPVQPFPLAHFATFPTELTRICILAGSRPGDVVLDPFLGSGTTGLMAHHMGRGFIGIELNQEYAEMAKRRISGPLFAGA